MRATALSLAATLLGAAAAPAAAQEHPPYMPMHDVMVEYEVHGSPTAPPTLERMYVTAGGTLVRFEAAGRGTYVIVDRAQRRLFMVMARRHAYIERPFEPKFGHSLSLDDSMRFARQGQDSVAGHDCTVWAVETKSAPARACITDDGVVLRAQIAGPYDSDRVVEARSVIYAPQSEGLFNPPPSYQRLHLRQASGSPPG